MTTLAERGAPQVTVESRSHDGRIALAGDRARLGLPKNAFGYFLNLRFSVNKTALTDGGAKPNELLWIKQTLDVNGIVWKRCLGDAKKFDLHVEEYFRLLTLSGTKERATKKDSHWRWWLPRPRQDGEIVDDATKGYCGLFVLVQATLEVGRLFAFPGGGGRPRKDGAHESVLDTGASTSSGATAGVGASKKRGEGSVDIGSPRVRQGCARQKSAQKGEFCFEADDHYPASAYWYVVYRDNCPCPTITPPDCPRVRPLTEGGDRKETGVIEASPNVRFKEDR